MKPAISARTALGRTCCRGTTENSPGTSGIPAAWRAAKSLSGRVALRFNISDYDLKAESHVTKERDQQPHHEDTLQGFCNPARNFLRAIRCGTRLNCGRSSCS